MNGQELKEARWDRGWEQGEAAERVGGTQGYLSMMEGGRGGVRLAAGGIDTSRQRKLSEYAGVLERSRLVREDTLCHESLTAAERKWLRENRPAEARHWNLLTDMRVENLVHGTA